MQHSCLLTWIIFTPMIFGAFVMLMPKNMENNFRKIALIQTLVNAVLATFLYVNFDGGSSDPQFVQMVQWPLS